MEGTPLDDLPWCRLFGRPDDLGLFLRCSMYALYKRSGFGDFAQYVEIFGQPVRVIRYDAYDKKTQEELRRMADSAGASLVMMLPKQAEFEMLDGKSSNGTGELQERLISCCNQEMSIAILGNSETTVSSASSGYAQAEVHADQQFEVTKGDLRFVQNALNERACSPSWPPTATRWMAGGSSSCPRPTWAKLNKRLAIDLKVAERVPVADDYWYETYGIPKPRNYEELKRQREEERQAMQGGQPSTPPRRKLLDGFSGKPRRAGRGNRPRLFRGRAARPRLVRHRVHARSGGGSLGEHLPHPLRPAPRAGAEPAGGHPGIFAGAVDEGAGDSPDMDGEFRRALVHSADVFAAFRVHRTQQDIAARMLDEEGRLKKFLAFRAGRPAYLAHQNRAWLRTEYDTAVQRAHQAARWKQFEAERDVLPNLRWEPSTSPTPGADHRVFWNTVRPIDDPFWSAHRPGDRWNCKCSLEATDDGPTAPPADAGEADRPAPGLDNNPGRDGTLINDRHPYFPRSCAACPLAKNRLAALWAGLKVGAAKGLHGVPVGGPRHQPGGTDAAERAGRQTGFPESARGNPRQTW